MGPNEVRYITRTVEHIHRVQKNAVFLVTKHADLLDLDQEDIENLLTQVMRHDRTKFSKEQFRPYVKMQMIYDEARKNNTNASSELKLHRDIDLAVKHHFKNESHHPEFWEGEIETMCRLSIIECACDLQAMAQEFKEGSFRRFYEDKWSVKHRTEISRCNFDVDSLFQTILECFENAET